nr:MAG TPA: hypothetical protein [Caudoviricetes sp.]
MSSTKSNSNSPSKIINPNPNKPATKPAPNTTLCAGCPKETAK